jgi:tetratricopeptide (TPR) repeat protein
MSKKAAESRSRINKAALEYKAGNYESAIITLTESAVTEDDYLELAYLLGLCYLRQKKYDEALLYLEQIVTSGGESSEAETRTYQCRLSLAYIYSQTERLNLAEYELKKLIDSPFESVMVRSALGHAEWMQGKIKDGIKWYERALEIDPENLNALNGYGYLLACEGKQLKKSLQYCQKANDKSKNNPVYADSLGWVYFKLGKMDLAAQYLYQARVELDGNKEMNEHIKALEEAAHKR